MSLFPHPSPLEALGCRGFPGSTAQAAAVGWEALRAAAAAATKAGLPATPCSGYPVAVGVIRGGIRSPSVQWAGCSACRASAATTCRDFAAMVLTAASHMRHLNTRQNGPPAHPPRHLRSRLPRPWLRRRPGATQTSSFARRHPRPRAPAPEMMCLHRRRHRRLLRPLLRPVHMAAPASRAAKRRATCAACAWSSHVRLG
mmetsp:Transcript_18134/g.32298  ORF Transcript_18134/g.32298 Transcript_18134/m.32298 type:complete len:200 (-) Transcript_18134:220-819(-)